MKISDTLAEGQEKHVMGYEITQGVAPGYVEDAACGQCHKEIFESYQHVGMGRSFSKPRDEKFIENFGSKPFYHDLSQNYYQMQQKGNELTFKQFQKDDEGLPINVFQQDIDWILGSGNKTRSYLYQTNYGELYQLPIAWYSDQQKWGMSPGYDKKNHIGVQRKLNRRCLFCHNAYPEMPQNSDASWQPHVFPKDLPEGIGCQRCHGPGASHIKALVNGKSLDKIRSAIVNPKNLPDDKRDSVCFQCHLLPTIAVIGVRDFNRGDYSFRPGELLSDYVHALDIEEEGKEKEHRFEINHQAYRLRQSECFQKSKGQLSCISCHNPHKKVAQDEKKHYFKNTCVSCHNGKQHFQQEECIDCHMPQTRTQDVVQVIMTDHKIQQYILPEKERLKPLKEAEHIITGVELLMPEKTNEYADIYRFIGLLRAQVSPVLVSDLAKMINLAKPKELTPYAELIGFQLKVSQFDEALITQKTIDRLFPDFMYKNRWLGSIYMGLDQYELAEKHYLLSIGEEPNRVHSHFQLGLLYYKTQRYKLALISLNKSNNLFENNHMQWFYLAHSQHKLNSNQNAIRSFKRALEIKPSFTEAYISLIPLLLKINEPKEAQRYFQHGLKVAAYPDFLSNEMAKFGLQIK